MNTTVLLQLERLRRHYEAAVHTYDKVAFLDLSHALRIWVELKQSVVSIAPALATTMAFKTGIPAKKVLKAARGHRYVFCYMPGGVITYAANGHISSGPGMDDASGDFTSGASVKIGQDHLWLGKFCIVSTAFPQPLIKALEGEAQTRCNYQQWLGAEAVRLAYLDKGGNLKAVAISREMVVKRVANTLDGSHPSVAGGEADNAFDAPVHHLLQYFVGGLPLPYYILLKIAQDILEIAPKLLGVTTPPAAT